MSRGRRLGALLGCMLALMVWAAPPIGELGSVGQAALAIIVLAVVLWATGAIDIGITAVLMAGLLIVAGVPSPTALSGYASPAFWILVCVLFFGYAMDKTGLAKRLAYRVLLAFRPTYAGILFAFLTIGFLLTLGIPSMTVRTAIMVPIAVAVVQTLRLESRSHGSALIVLSAFEMAVLPGCALLTGALWGPYIAGLLESAGLQITWLGYASVMAVPTLIWCVLVLAANLLVLRPQPLPSPTGDLVRDGLRELGAIERSEVVTAVVISLAVLTWALQPWHGIPAEAVGMLALPALFAAGVLVPAEIGTGISWTLVLFIGGMLSLTTVITTYGINAWLGRYIAPAIVPSLQNPFAFVAMMVAAVVAMRFLDPVGFITIAAFLLPLVGTVAESGIPPLVLTGVILLPVHVFWFNYQNIWVAMTHGISKGASYTSAHRIRLATVFVSSTMVTLWISVLYWRLIGAL